MRQCSRDGPSCTAQFCSLTIGKETPIVQLLPQKICGSEELLVHKTVESSIDDSNFGQVKVYAAGPRLYAC